MVGITTLYVLEVLEDRDPIKDWNKTDSDPVELTTSYWVILNETSTETVDMNSTWDYEFVTEIVDLNVTLQYDITTFL